MSTFIAFNEDVVNLDLVDHALVSTLNTTPPTYVGIVVTANNVSIRVTQVHDNTEDAFGALVNALGAIKVVDA